MNCKRCNKPIEAHEAGPDTDRCVAEVVMRWGWAMCGDGKRRLIGHDGVSIDIWSPSTDANAMLEVVEEMRRQGFRFSCSHIVRPIAEFFRGDDVGPIGTADTLPLAVIRAALAAKGGAS